MFFHWLFLSSVPGSGQQATSSVGKGGREGGVQLGLLWTSKGCREARGSSVGVRGRGEREQEGSGAGQLAIPQPHPRFCPGATPALSSPHPGRIGTREGMRRSRGKPRETSGIPQLFRKVKNARPPHPTPTPCVTLISNNTLRPWIPQVRDFSLLRHHGLIQMVGESQS